MGVPDEVPSFPISSAAALSPLEGNCEVSCLHPDSVSKAKLALPGHHWVEDASALLKTVADPTRLRLLSALSTGELCVCDLAAVIGISESAVSHQLRLLRTHRLVAFRKEGRVAYYRLLDHHVTVLIGSALEHVQESRVERSGVQDSRSQESTRVREPSV